MKKRVISLAAVFLLVLSLSAQAADTRAVSGSPKLTISGTTATCSVRYVAGTKDSVSVTLSLKENGVRVASWSDSGTGSVTISEEYNGVKSGNRYELVLHAVVNGTVKPDVSVTVRT